MANFSSVTLEQERIILLISEKHQSRKSRVSNFLCVGSFPRSPLLVVWSWDCWVISKDILKNTTEQADSDPKGKECGTGCGALVCPVAATFPAPSPVQESSQNLLFGFYGGFIKYLWWLNHRLLVISLTFPPQRCAEQILKREESNLNFSPNFIAYRKSVLSRKWRGG